MKTKRVRKEEALERQAIYDKLSIKQRIALAQSRRGNSKKEIEKLQEQLKKEK